MVKHGFVKDENCIQFNRVFKNKNYIYKSTILQDYK